jgi:hypothetical protein
MQYGANGIDVPPNALRISRAAPIGWECFHVMIPRKIGTISLAGTASGCMRWLGGTTPEGRVDPPAMLASAGAPHDDLRGQSFPALMDAMTVGCAVWNAVRGRSRRFRSHHDGGRMRAVGIAPEGVPGDDLSRQWMRCP